MSRPGRGIVEHLYSGHSVVPNSGKMTQSKNWSRPDRGNWGTTHCVDQHLLENHSGGLVLTTVLWLAGWCLPKSCYICLMINPPGKCKTKQFGVFSFNKVITPMSLSAFPNQHHPGRVLDVPLHYPNTHPGINVTSNFVVAWRH